MQVIRTIEVNNGRRIDLSNELTGIRFTVRDDHGAIEHFETISDGDIVALWNLYRYMMQHRQSEVYLKDGEEFEPFPVLQRFGQ